MIDQIFSYREMCEQENVQTLQRGMNFRLNPNYSVILMSRRSNAPYRDSVLEDGITIEYEGHDEPKTDKISDPKIFDQPKFTRTGSPTQNGLFIKAAKNLHFDHDLPFSKGGTSLTAKNIRLLCAKCNLSKSDKIE